MSRCYDSNELSKSRTVAKNAIVLLKGEREVMRDIEYYNLNAIISVSYRINSKQRSGFPHDLYRVSDKNNILIG